MAIVSPSILSADFANLERDINKIKNAGAQYVHVDVMDGQFVKNITIGAPVVKSIRKCTDLVLDVHLMITQPERYIDDFINAGSDIITFHLESTDKADEIIEKIKSAGIKAGITVKPNTPVEDTYKYLDRVDMVLLMSVEPGFGGQKYIESTNEKIIALKKEIIKTGRDIDIEIDGGITEENVSEVVKKGVNVIVAGSAIFNSNDIIKTVSYMKNLV